MLTGFLGIYNNFVPLAIGEPTPKSFTVVGLSIVSIMVGLLTFHSANSEKPRRLIPVLVFMTIQITLLLFFIFGFIMFQFIPDVALEKLKDHYQQDKEPTVGELRTSLLLMTLLFACLTALSLWFLKTIYTCFRFLKLLKKPEETEMSHVERMGEMRY
ncbi:hypothetical protein L596_022221 [Steinernema carpocapsae]|nr:hypothetical protein L596_022221 [Steinernema carpocapsae]